MSSSRASTQSSPSPHPVLPPIIKNAKDRRFLQELNGFIAQEMAMIDNLDFEQRYTVHKAAFDKVIDYVRAYRPLLNAIKAEYEDFIDTIKRGRREADHLSGKLQTMAAEPSTLRNYRKRSEELEKKLDIIRHDNQRLSQQLEALKLRRQSIEEQKSKEVIVVKKEVKKDPRKIPGLSIEEATNPQVLLGEYVKLDEQLKELNSTWKVNYKPKTYKENLQDQLTTKVDVRDDLVEKGESLKERRQRLRLAIDAANKYKKAPLFNQTIGDAVADSFRASLEEKSTKLDTGALPFPQETSGGVFEDDDPAKEREADMMLEYIGKFNELFEERKYEEAAIHAANSPKGILRTMETLNKFKNIGEGYGRSPLLAFCDALMSSVLALGVKPSEVMSTECVKCALVENRLDLLSHWISQERLTVTETLGDLIVEYCNKNKNRTYLSLAESIYLRVDARMKTLRVLIQQGRVKRATEFAVQGPILDRDSWLKLLSDFPSPQLAQALTEKHPKLNDSSILPVGVVVRALLDIDQFNLGLNLLQHLYIQGPQQGDRNEPSILRKAVFEDGETTLDEWHDIVKQCQDTGYEEVALELLAAVTVLRIMRFTTRDNTTMESLGSDNSDGGPEPSEEDSENDEDNDSSRLNTTESERKLLRTSSYENGSHCDSDDEDDDER